MTVVKGIQGQWMISSIVGGYLVAKQYFGYTKREAVSEYKKDVKAS